MSYGIVICSACRREVHQVLPGADGWRHCEDGTPRCAGAVSAYPNDTSEIAGKWCGRDDVDDGLAGLPKTRRKAGR